MKPTSLLLTAIAFIGLQQTASAQYLDDQRSEQVTSTIQYIDQVQQEKLHPQKVASYVSGQNGEWLLNSTTSYTYQADGKVASILYVPTPLNKKGYALETIKTQFLTYNDAGKPLLSKRYLLKNGLFTEIEKKTRIYDDHGNLTELHTLYKGEKEYVYANYDGSYKFHYTYDSKGRPTEIQSEYYYLGYTSGWYKGSKRILTYNDQGQIESIERLPYSFLTNDYTHAGACRYTHIKWDAFSFEDFFFSGQNLDLIPGVKGYQLEKWDETAKDYITIKSQTGYSQLNQSELVRIVEQKDRNLRYETVKNPETGMVSTSTVTDQDGAVMGGVQHNYLYQTDGKLAEEITKVWMPEKRSFIAQERKVYVEESPAASLASTNSIGIRAFPNPFSNSTQLSYTLPTNQKVVIELYSILGAKIATYADEEQLSGKHEISISDLEPGNYIIKAQLGNQQYSYQLVRSEK